MKKIITLMYIILTTVNVVCLWETVSTNINTNVPYTNSPWVLSVPAPAPKTQKIPGIGEYAEDDVDPAKLKNLKIKTYTSEPCTMAGNEKPIDSGSKATRQDDRYECTVSATDGFVTFISSIYKYVFFISLVIGVLVMIVIGIMISITGILPEGEEFRDEAKKKIMDIFIGLVALAMIPWLLKTIAPFFFV